MGPDTVLTHRFCGVSATFRRSQGGLTLLEVLIALSIFAMIGVASFRVLSSVVDTQKVGDVHSQQLTRLQKVLTLIDADLEQVVERNIRISEAEVAEYLEVKTGDYALQFTRGGWRNPLQLSRSSLQRIAYDVGPHPDRDKQESSHYQDDKNYLRRHYWRVLDRESSEGVIVQALLADVTDLTVAVINKNGRFTQWPVPKRGAPKAQTEDDKKANKPLALEFSFIHSSHGQLTRLYKIN